jgi:hypothetical protein
MAQRDHVIGTAGRMSRDGRGWQETKVRRGAIEKEALDT